MASLPRGTVTFLFTDVERSTNVLEQLGADGYAEALAEHAAAIRAASAAHGGVEVDTQGDSFFIAFGRAHDAVAAAHELQASLAHGPIRVRVGIHTGEPLVTATGYVGMDVHRAARIAAAAHGGQVVVSQATRDLLAGDRELVDLGEHRLKDLTRRERLYQLGHDAFPPLRSMNRSNLPEAAHPLVGRDVERRELARLVRETKLVTITGPGGTGKTRLALQVAADVSDEFRDGVYFVSLASVSDPALVVPVALEALGDAGASTAALLVLDNFEHLLAAAPRLAHVLTQSPGPTVLVTSRIPLHISMEHEYELDPLPLDAAIEMFLDRSRAPQRPLDVTPTIDEICRRLDCLPLALELAAARLKLLDPQALLLRLESRLPILTQGATDLPERQRTLEATIAWSYDLLDAEAQQLFARLSIFAGTFSDEAAEAVVGADLDALSTLVDASLLKSRRDGRFLMLETIREFARNHLPQEDAAALVDRHAVFFTDLAERAAPALTGRDAAAWLARLDADHGNLRAALDWCALERPGLQRRLALALWRFWLVRGHYEEGQLAIERAIAADPASPDSAELRYRLGAIVISRGEVEQGRAYFESAHRDFVAQGDASGEARALAALGHVAADARRWQEAIERYERAAQLSRRLDDRQGLANVLGDLATVHLRSGAPARSLPLAAESAEIQRSLGNRQGEALGIATAGYAHLELGDLEQAHARLAEATAIAHELGYLHGLVFSLNGLAALAYRRGDVARAADTFAATERLRATIGIHHDPDDLLVAAARAATLGERRPDDATVGEVNVDDAVAVALGS